MDVKGLREAAGFSQQELASRLGVSQSLVAHWESGRREPSHAQRVLLRQVFVGGAEVGPEAPRTGPLLQRPGARVAMVCPRCEAAGAPRRHFGDLAWLCPEHGVSVRQANRPYMGVPVA